MKSLSITLLLSLSLAACMQPASLPSQSASKPALQSGVDKSGFDPSVRAQDDFFEAYNGGWLQNTEIPSDQARWGSFNILHEKSQNDIRALVEVVSRQQNVAAGSAAQKIRDYYNAYMDQESADRKGIDPIRDELQQIASARDMDDIYRLFANLGVVGINSPLGVFVFSDARDANTNVVYISESGLSLPDRDYYLEDSERYAKGRELFKTYATAVFEMAGVDDATAKAEQQLAIETRLAEVHWTREDNRDPVKSYNPMNPTELKALTPAIDWNLMFDQVGIPPRDRYIVSQPSYFSAVNDILTETPVSAWKDYLTFHTVSTFASILGQELFALNFEFRSKGLRGVEEPRALWKRAVSSTNGNMGELLGQLYVEKHFSPDAKTRMIKMIDNLVAAYDESIRGLDWMGEETKEEALRKLSKFTPKIGYPDNWRDYSALKVVAGDLVGNIKRARTFEFQRNINKLDQPVDKTEWFMTPQTVNAYYNPYWNEIVFPASILQPPFFNVAADDAVNYGAIGAGIGHEIGHGFDDQGRKFDGDGNLRDWWTEEDNARFETRKKKLAAQYNSYEVIDGLTINGEFTSGENIGDLGGLSIALKAYRISLAGKEAPVIDGMTGDQRFFIGWAQVWRTKSRDEETKRLLTIDPHSPPRFRANGAVVNIPEFYSAFDVQEGDQMYLPPEDRVRIW
ncbi:MAG: M13 family metallopeptidase [Gammaproteobacteria bacterium]|nr:M13 family metallopeptidase [Gammaproteobacteria bacterium]